MAVTPEEARENLKRGVASYCDSLYSLGYSAGYDSAIEKVSALREDTAIDAPTEKEAEEYKSDRHEELSGWCAKCKRPIGGYWHFAWGYCPWCGRKIKKEESRT